MKVIHSAWEEEEVFTEESAEELLENDQISIEEEAFMLGWNEAG